MSVNVMSNVEKLSTVDHVRVMGQPLQQVPLPPPRQPYVRPPNVAANKPPR